MEKLYATLLVLSFAFSGFAQIDYQYLEFNNVRALLSNGGVFFNDADLANPGYEVPSGSGNHGIYSMSFWFGGEDSNGQLKLAATTYEQEGDFFPGALTVDGTASLPAEEEASKQIYLISQSQIDYHMANFGEVGYEMPEVIENWPAHGDPEYNLAYYLAPFQDTDGDGIYDPTVGDYPLIKGDQAVYMILNDKGGEHSSGGEVIGMELHLLFYQYANESFQNNTTYLNMRVINRGLQTLFNFYSACFLDADIGSSTDDFVGFNEDANVMYGYNGSNFDANYGENPPAIGVTLLNREVAKFAAISDTPGPTGLPATGADYYNYMRGQWLDGTSFTEGGTGYGGEEETDFLYDGNPLGGGWTEGSVDNIPGERKMMMSNQHFGGAFTPGMELCYDYAILYSAGSNYIDNAVNAIYLAENAHTTYLLEENPYCEHFVSGIEEEHSTPHFEIFPNPSLGTFQVVIEGDYLLEIYSIDGRVVHQTQLLNGKQIIQPNLTPGTYIVNITQNEKSYQSKLMIK